MSDLMFHERQDRAADSRSIDVNEVGTVVRKASGRYIVRGADARARTCVVAGGLRKAQSRAGGGDDFVAVGDAVHVEWPRGNGDGVIRALEPRRNAFVRRAAGRKAQRQVIAANVDQVVAVVPFDASARTGIVDRFLVEAEAAGLPPVVCVTKSDLAPDAAAFALYERLGYAVVRTSAVTGEGLTTLRAALAACTSVLVGMSGAGKSSILNALVPDLSLRTATLSGATGKGRHTTTSVELFDLPASVGGGAVIDTPGVREFGLWDARDAGGLAGCFPEMRPLLGRCRFTDCTHGREPGCAIADAALRGEIDPRRRRSYLRMLGSGSTEGETSHDADSQRAGSIEAERAARTPTGAFRCANCNQPVAADTTSKGSGGAPGSAHRNHCPRCLYSVHVDFRPGDRAAACGAVMEPITVWVRRGGEWALIHRCTSCGTLHSNRVAGDDNELALVAMAVKPLANFPFPVEHLSGGKNV